MNRGGGVKPCVDRFPADHHARDRVVPELAVGPEPGSRWSARSAARTNDLEAGEDPPILLVDTVKCWLTDRRNGPVIEQRSSLYGLLGAKDQVWWEAAPVAQFHAGVVKRPEESRGLPGGRVRSS